MKLGDLGLGRFFSSKTTAAHSLGRDLFISSISEKKMSKIYKLFNLGGTNFKKSLIY